MKDNTPNQNEKYIEMFLEALRQVPNIFKGESRILHLHKIMYSAY